MEKKTKKILILAEGYEEEPYIKKILNFPTIRKDIYQFSVINVKGSQKIVPRFQHEFAKNWYDMILIFIDLKNANISLNNLINKIDCEVFGEKTDFNKLDIKVNDLFDGLQKSSYIELGNQKLLLAYNLNGI